MPLTAPRPVSRLDSTRPRSPGARPSVAFTRHSAGAVYACNTHGVPDDLRPAAASEPEQPLSVSGKPDTPAALRLAAMVMLAALGTVCVAAITATGVAVMAVVAVLVIR